MTYVRRKRSIFARSVWVMLAVFFALLTIVFAVGSSIAADNAAPINKTLGAESSIRVQVGGGSGEVVDHYPSAFIERYADGSPIYQVDEYGNKTTIMDDEPMRENSQKVAEQVAVEGTVLLWNDNDTLPLAEGSKVSLFGIASAKGKYALSGYGSGKVDAIPTDGSLADALSKKGLVVNTKLDEKYESLTDSSVFDGNFNYGLHQGSWNGDRNFMPVYCVNEVPWSVIGQTASETVNGDTAVMVVSRRAGEDSDIIDNVENNETDVDGGMNHLELTTEEAEVLSELAALKSGGKISHIVLLLNTANPLQFKEITKEEYGIDACVWTGIGGTEALVQVADVLSGKGDYVMSGHAPDALLMYNHATPADANYGDFTWTNGVDDVMERLKDLPYIESEFAVKYQTHNTKYVVYREGIYVGYRYFETRYEDYVLGVNGADSSVGSFTGSGWKYSDHVAFPFGYGLSYTTFEYGKPSFSYDEKEGTYTVTMNITNTGDKYVGKDVLQVYLQKPYTEYDKEKAHPVEKSAVELVGFAKTDALAPGQSQEISVTVDEETFRTYDSYGQRTYILEKGDYYLSVGTDSHDALNNILAAKGYTPANTDGRMDAEGDADMTYRVTVSEDDFEKFSVADTGAKITNHFDDADLNLYEGTKDDQSITYLSRSDWAGTYPTEGVKLKLENDRMVYDMNYGHEVPVAEDDTMPVSGEITYEGGRLNLAMMEDLEYNDPLWQNLLDQMTFEEQTWMMSYGMGFISSVASVDAPGLKASDGPQGVYSTKYAFPSPVMTAATFNAPLAYTLGDAYAHEGMHAGYSMLYAPGANMHRTLYCGRNFEYYSEDGFLAGKILAAQSKGIMDRGIIVLTKHFAFNDQEWNRYGLATFFNEQSAREIYLRPFETAVRESGMNGVMSSFNRVGLTWAGAHKGLLTDVLRNEWGFIGIVETDACSATHETPHMEDRWALAEGLVAGNDLWMARGSKTWLDDSKDNATVRLALREACHRMLYVQLHSAAMNGMSVNTRVIPITPWWQSLLTLIVIIFATATALSVIMAILSFLVRADKIPSLSPSRTSYGVGGKSSGTGAAAPVRVKKKLSPTAVNAIIGCTLAGIMIVTALVSSLVLFGNHIDLSKYGASGTIDSCTHHCPVCGLCTDETSENPACAEKCECTRITIEAESEYVERVDGTATWGGMSVGTDEERDVTYVKGLDGNVGATLTFKILSEGEGRALLSATVRRRPWDFDLHQFLAVSANGENVDYEVRLPGTVGGANVDDGSDGTGDFYTFNIRNIPVIEGLNTITFTVTEKSGGQCPHFDKIDIISSAAVSEYMHRCDSKCEVCGKCTDYECEDTILCGEKCECTTIKIEAESEYVDRTDGSTPNGISTKTDANLGVTYVAVETNNRGAALTFGFMSDAAGKAQLIAFMRRMPWDFPFHEYVEVAVNGTAFPLVKLTLPGTGEDDSTFGTGDFYPLTIGVIDVQEGYNYVTFKAIEKEYAQFPDFDKIELRSPLTLAEYTHRCTNACPVCGKCTDEECDDTVVCGEKCECNVLKLEGESEFVTYAPAPTPMWNSVTQAQPSGDNAGYICIDNQNTGAWIKFTFMSEEDSNAAIAVYATRKQFEYYLHNDCFISLNDGEKIVGTARIDGNSELAGNAWSNEYVRVELGIFPIKAGANTLYFETTGYAGVRIDRVEVQTPAIVTEYTHRCTSVCPVCGNCTDSECDDEISCGVKCECVTLTLEGESDGVSIVQADTPMYGGVTQVQPTDGNPGYVRIENDNQGASFTFTFEAAAAGSVNFAVYVTPFSYDYYLHDIIDVCVNDGDPITGTPIIMEDPDLEDNHWADTYVRLDLGAIEINAGENTISFTTKGYSGIKVDKIELKGDVLAADAT